MNSCDLPTMLKNIKAEKNDIRIERIVRLPNSLQKDKPVEVACGEAGLPELDCLLQEITANFGAGIGK